jgi:hypothetical protein
MTRPGASRSTPNRTYIRRSLSWARMFARNSWAPRSLTYEAFSGNPLPNVSGTDHIGPCHQGRIAFRRSLLPANATVEKATFLRAWCSEDPEEPFPLSPRSSEAPLSHSLRMSTLESAPIATGT